MLGRACVLSYTEKTLKTYGSRHILRLKLKVPAKKVFLQELLLLLVMMTNITLELVPVSLEKNFKTGYLSGLVLHTWIELLSQFEKLQAR